MKNLAQNINKVKNATANTETVDCLLHYSVTLDITHIDNDGVPSTIREIEEEFRAPIALEARRNAFAYAFKLSQDAEIDGRLCEGHLDSPLEARAKGSRNINMLSLNVNYIDQTGVTMPVFEQSFIAPDEDELEALALEYAFYVTYGYDTGGAPHTVENKDGEKFKILNFANNKASDTIYCIGSFDAIDDIRQNGIKAEDDGYILFLTTEDIADNYVRDQCFCGGKYALIDVSTWGIHNIIKPYNIGEFAACHQRLVRQKVIDPKFIKRIRVVDSLDKKFYVDYHQNLGMLQGLNILTD